MSETAALGGIRAILLDIEGTTTPIVFVFEVLFPYARRHLRRHLEQHATSPEYEVLFDRLRDDHASDRSAGEPVPPWVDAPPAARLASVASYSEWLMDRDRKSTALKVLQGKIWEEGYARGELVGDVFVDVPGALERWRAQHLQIGIFSSGSVLAQRLLFRHSSAGDLSRFLQWYFDTTIGAKSGQRELSPHRNRDGASTRGHSVRLGRDQRARRGAPRRHAHDAVGQARKRASPGRTRLPGRSHIRRTSLILRSATEPIDDFQRAAAARHKARAKSAILAAPVLPERGTRMKIDRLHRCVPVCVLLTLWVSLTVAGAQAPAVPPAPTLSCAEMETFLKTAKMGPRKGISTGITLPSRAPLDDGKLRHDAAIQTVDVTKTMHQTRRGTELNFRDTWQFNVAGYELAKMLELNMVPPYVERKVSGLPASVSWWVSDAMMERDRFQKKIAPPDREKWFQETHAAKVFHELIANSDSNMTNMLITKDWRVWMIDFSRAFRPAKALQDPKELTKIDRKLLANLRRLSGDELQQRLGRWLHKPEIESVLARRDLIVRLFDNEVATKGEAAVLYDLPRSSEPCGAGLL